jgi:hypothetical protein
MKPNGPAVAAVLSAAAGVFTLGFLYIAGEVVGTVRNLLTWSQPIGSITGKAAVAIVVWLLLWAFLSGRYRGQNVDAARLLRLAWVLIIAGFVFTLPLVAAALGGLR